jgi:radical SAM superfamily enzyme YgiQ (UPF0313 family)
MLLANKSWFRNLCQLLKENKIRWSCALRPDMIDEEIINLLKRSGCEEVTLGLDVIYDWNPEGARKLTKIYKLKEIAHLSKLFRNKKIKVNIYLIGKCTNQILMKS